MPALYRGLSVAPDHLWSSTKLIKLKGYLSDEEATFRTDMAEPALVRNHTTEWLRTPAAIQKNIDTAPKFPRSIVCGDLFRASQGAHGGAGVAAIVEYDIPWESLKIDGRDFLHAVFALWDRKGDEHRDRVRQTLGEIFGRALLKYFDLANGDLSERIGLCELATYDLDVIQAHHANAIEIRGRSSMRHCSAFQCSLPLERSAIRNVIAPAAVCPEPGQVASLDDMTIP